MTNQCELCGADGAKPQTFTSIVDGSAIVAHYCDSCKAEIDEHNAEYQPKPARVNWRQFFGVEDETASLNTFYSGVEA
jgi:ribosome-binding protein aMBF1 (putative translation factor)